MKFLGPDWRLTLWSVGAVVAAYLFSRLLHSFLFRVAKRFNARKQTVLAQSLLYSEKPVRLLLFLLVEMSVVPFLPLNAWLQTVLRRGIGLCLIAAVAWLLIAMLNVVEGVLTYRYSETSTTLEARRVQTQVQVLRRIAVILIVVLAIAAMLMTFPSIRHVGESLFASAGLAAVVAGLAARTMLSNLLAGVQIALTQPIRLEDVVIVEGEWGWIEEITTTFVVVRIWDLRRLILPISFFIEKPFQNWTRKSADLLGTVFLYADYSVPVEEVRQELHRVLQSTELWDGKVWTLQVTNANERSLELRALMSASDGGRAWDLRCLVREKLLQFLQHNYPECLPKTRAELTGSLSARQVEGSVEAA